MNKISPAVRLTVLAGLMSMTSLADAATATSNFDVTLQVDIACTLNVGTLVFSPINTQNTGGSTGSTTATIDCGAQGESWSMTISDGNNPIGASGTDRQMISGSDLLAYSLTEDSTGSFQALNTGSAALTGSTDATGTSVITINGSVAGGTNIPGGSYSDTLTAQITF